MAQNKKKPDTKKVDFSDEMGKRIDFISSFKDFDDIWKEDEEKFIRLVDEKYSKKFNDYYCDVIARDLIADWKPTVELDKAIDKMVKNVDCEDVGCKKEDPRLPSSYLEEQLKKVTDSRDNYKQNYEQVKSAYDNLFKKKMGRWQFWKLALISGAVGFTLCWIFCTIMNNI